MKELVKKVPFLRSAAKLAYLRVVAPLRSFPGSEDYWKHRYDTGRNSGSGSYKKFAQFKAEVLNEFVDDNGVETVIEYGSGDGNQLTLAAYPFYTGFDVSQAAVETCRKLFDGDQSKTFELVRDYENQTAQLTLSLDVIYHLVEDEVYEAYMKRLFDSSTRYVIIYSSNTDEQENLQLAHVKHRTFSAWVDRNKAGWQLKSHIPNRYPYSGDDTQGSFADFYIYQRVSA